MRRISRLFAAILCAACVISCSSIPQSVPEDLTAREIIQKAQEASDKNDWSSAAFYYRTALERYPDDLQTVCACEYEIAFIEYKNTNYSQAKELFTKLLARYQGADAQLLPSQYKVLAEKILAKTEEALRAK